MSEDQTNPTQPNPTPYTDVPVNGFQIHPTPPEIKVPKYRLKSGFKLLSEQRKKILNIPLDGVKISIDSTTKEISFDIGRFFSNQRDLIEYLIPLFYENTQSLENPILVSIDDLDNFEYKEMEAKIKEINPFNVFDIKIM